MSHILIWQPKNSLPSIPLCERFRDWDPRTSRNIGLSGHRNTLWGILKAGHSKKSTTAQTAVRAADRKMGALVVFNLPFKLMEQRESNSELQEVLHIFICHLVQFVLWCVQRNDYTISVHYQLCCREGINIFRAQCGDIQYVWLYNTCNEFFSWFLLLPIHSTPCCNAWWAGSILCMTPATSVGRCQLSLLILFVSTFWSLIQLTT